MLGFYQQSVFYSVLFSVWELRKLVNHNENPEILETDFENPVSHPKDDFHVFAENSPKISCRTTHRNAYFTYFREFVYNLVRMVF